MATIYPRLQRRNGTYYLRVAVPRHLQPVIGKREIRRSLRTGNYAEALHKIRLESPKVDQGITTAATTGQLDMTLYPLRQRTTHPLPEKGVTLAELTQLYLTAPKRQHLARKSLNNYNSIFAFFTEVMGEDTPVRSFTRHECRAVRDLLLALPANARKHYPATPLKDIPQQPGAAELPRLSPSNVNKYMTTLSALFAWAVTEEYMERNPAQGLTVTDNVQAHEKRWPFTIEHLTVLFEALTPARSSPTDGKFWIPLIALYTGMRLNEICQLYTSDIYESGGVGVIAVRPADDGSKRVKTENSVRFIPVHPVLREAGLLAFVAQQREQGHERLFHELKRTCKGDYSDNYSKWFARFLKQTGVKHPKLCFHSFRHTFRDALREAGIEREVALALGGWSAGGSTAEIYGSGFSVQRLYDAVCRIRYAGLEIEALSAC